MNWLRAIVHHPAALLGAVLLGAWAGMLWPQGAPLFAALSSIYLSLIQVAALPFLVLAVYFGLQRMAAAGEQWRRLGGLALLGLLLMLLCALGGAMLASLGAAGAGLDAGQEASLGRMAMHAEAPAVVSLHAPEPPVATPAVPPLVPHNLYAVMAFGSAPSVLIGVLLFGAAVAVQRPEASRQLNAILEAVYRGMELAIRCVNTGLPLTACILAAAATSAAGGESIGLLTGFLATWYGSVLLCCALVAGLLAWRLKAHPWQVLTALREPVTVCLFAPVGAAALPEFIEALSVRLGFSRGVVEIMASICPVFIRTGEALYFAVLAVFVAHVYGRPPGVADLLLISFLAGWTALWAIGVPGMKAALWAGVLQASLGLPLDAMLPVLLLLEVLCEGARNLVSYLAAAVLIALGCEAVLPRHAPAAGGAVAAPLLLVLGRRQAWLGAGLLAAALLLVFGAGIGAGLRKMLVLS